MWCNLKSHTFMFKIYIQACWQLKLSNFSMQTNLQKRAGSLFLSIGLEALDRSLPRRSTKIEEGRKRYDASTPPKKKSTL